MKRLSFIYVFLALMVLGSCADPEPLARSKGVRYYVQATVEPPENAECRLLVNGVVEQVTYFNSHSVYRTIAVKPTDKLALEVDDILDGYTFHITLTFNPSKDPTVFRNIEKKPGNSVLMEF